jgi:hypothetical protein
MVQITIEVPEALAERLAAVHERLPEVLAHGLEVLSLLPNEVYRALVDFLTNHPSPEAWIQEDQTEAGLASELVGHA